MGDLREYRAKRRPARTPEPVPQADTPTRRTAKRRGDPIFVIHEHRARRLHWDLRLERDGVLVSWALPRGLPPHSSQDQLAVHTEDHPMEYATFSGVIPKGEYGAGTMAIFDTGTYTPEVWTDHEVKVGLAGSRVAGRYALYRIGAGPDDENAWRIHLEKGQDSAGWEPVPADLRPMLASPASSVAAVSGPGWVSEFKWDGWRVLAAVEGGRVRLRTRNGMDVTENFPEIKALGRQAGPTALLLDGEVVATDEGRVSFAALQTRLGAEKGKASRLARTHPVSYMIFDVLHLDGRSLLGLRYSERRDLLEQLELSGDHWQTAPAFFDEPADLILAAAVDQGLEGIVAKRADSLYLPGTRSPDWRKVKTTRTQTVVIGGYTPLRSNAPDAAARTATMIGALLIGVVDAKGGLRYAGRVGGGFSDSARRDLHHALSSVTREDSPFSTAVPKPDAGPAVWTEPLLVAEVEYANWTRDGRLRAPVFKGLRLDVGPEQAVREEA